LVLFYNQLMNESLTLAPTNVKGWNCRLQIDWMIAPPMTLPNWFDTTNDKPIPANLELKHEQQVILEFQITMKN
jgi:hypothetical protein